MTEPRRAVFFDRDGVLVRDVGPLSDRDQVELMPGVGATLRTLRQHGFVLIGVSNQTVIARGLLDEAQVRELQMHIEDRIANSGGTRLDGFFFCPHHPEATVSAYRGSCPCRKPGTGLLEQARETLSVDLERSFMVGDRPSDVAAGARAGCRTVWLQSGKHDAPPIVGADAAPTYSADYETASLSDAAKWIVEVGK